MIFILYMIYFLIFNWFGMTTVGIQIVNSRVSSMQQRKKSQVWRSLWKLEVWQYIQTVTVYQKTMDRFRTITESLPSDEQISR